MSLKWTGSQCESGILRKSEFKEKKEELFVFGYSCKLFRDDAKAQHIDQGKHLIPWMGDDTLKIDRYDARGALHDLSTLEAPPGGYDWRVEFTKAELDVEQLCDEERYRALHTDEDEEEMYKEEELKRLHAAGYGQVGFNYEAPAEPASQPSSQPTEVDEPFVPTQAFKALLPVDMILPESQKLNAIIEKTAKFIANQGAQMEILIKAKQGDNPQFQFLTKGSTLHPYYTTLIALVKAEKWPEKKAEVVEEKQPENEEYLHPSLASAIIESAPSIPSIHYKPSADCDYTMLISKMRGEATLDETYPPELAPGEVAPPGTEPLPPRASAEISRAPVMYNRGQDESVQATQAQYNQYAAYYYQYMAQTQAQVQQEQKVVKKEPTPPEPLISTGLSLMKNYNTDSDSDVSDFEDSSSTDSKDKPTVLVPPEDIQVVIDKMATYVARNGDEFAEIVRAKNDPRFTFLDPDHMYHPYYRKLMQGKRGEMNGKERKTKRSAAPVSFSIKKQKEPDPILPKPALPYESSSEDDENKQSEKQEEREPQKVNTQPLIPAAIPQAVVYKLEGPQTIIPIVKAVEPKPIIQKPVIIITPEEPKIEPKVTIVEPIPKEEKEPPIEELKEKSVPPEEKIIKKEESKKETEKIRDREIVEHKTDKRNRDKKKEYRSKSENRDTRKSDRRSLEKDRKRDKEVEKHKRRKYSKEELENEIISLEDNSDDLIDLTGDQSDSKVECETEAERAKQLERRRRAAEFLKKVGVDPAAAALPTSSLASAMVDTLESLRKTREEKRRRDRRANDYNNEHERSHRKSKHRKYRSSDDNGESEYDSSKKKKRKKEKRHSSRSKRKRRREPEVEEQEQIIPVNLDLTNTLKELRNASPTKELGLHDVDNSQNIIRQDYSSDEDKEMRRNRKKKREDREYSEGEWSSNTEETSASKEND